MPSTDESELINESTINRRGPPPLLSPPPPSPRDQRPQSPSFFGFARKRFEDFSFFFSLIIKYRHALSLNFTGLASLI